MVSEQQVQNPCFGARRCQRREAGIPRSLGEPMTRAKALDHQNICCDASLTKSGYRLRCLLAKLATEAMIDHQRQKRPATVLCPGLGQQSQPHAVGTA